MIEQTIPGLESRSAVSVQRLRVASVGVLDRETSELQYLADLYADRLALLAAHAVPSEVAANAAAIAAAEQSLAGSAPLPWMRSRRRDDPDPALYLG